MKLDAVRTFCTVVNCGGIVGAAEKLEKTPSAVSMTLKKLEQNIGGALFAGERKTTLTALGTFVLHKGLVQLEQFEHFAYSVDRFAKAQEGALTILSVPSITKLLVVPCIQTYQQQAPQVHFTLGDTSSRDIVMQIQNGFADVGIISESRHTPTSTSGLETILLFTDSLGIACHTNHPLAKLPLVTWQDCTSHQLILNPLCHFVAQENIQEKLIHSHIEADNTHSILALLAEGIGFSILPESLQSILPTSVTFLSPKKPIFYRNVVAVFKQYTTLSPIAKKMLEILQLKSSLISEKLK